MKLTKEFLKQVLYRNNGYRYSVAYNGEIRESRYYTISNGNLYLRHIGYENDKPYDRQETCDIKGVRKFIIMCNALQRFDKPTLKLKESK